MTAVDALLQLLAAAGHPVPVGVLRAWAVLGDDALAVVARAEAAGLAEVSPDGMVQVVAGAVPSLGGLALARHRAELGRLLLGSGAVPAVVVARHRLAGLLVEDDAAAVPNALALARADARFGDLDEAIDLYRHVLHALDHGAEPAGARVAALAGLAEALGWAGRGDEAKAVVADATAVALRSGDPAHLAAAALAWTGRHIAVDDDPANLALVDRALEEFDLGEGAPRLAEHEVLVAQLLGLRVDRMVFTDLDEARRLSVIALDRARATGDAATIVRNAYSQRLAIWEPGTHDDVMALASEMVALSPMASDFPEFGTVTRLQVFLERGDFAHFDAELRSLQRRVDHGRGRGRFERVWAELFAGTAALVRGRWSEVGTHVTAARALTDGFDYDILDQLLLAQEMMVAWHEGADLSSLVTSDLLPAGPMRRSWTACLLGLSADRLDVDEVEVRLGEALVSGLDGLRRDLTWGPVVACLAMAAVRVRSTRHARLLHDALRPYEAQWAATGGAVTFGPVAWHLGRLSTVLGDLRGARADLEGALARCREAEAWPWSAHVHLALAELDGDDAADHAAAALEMARRVTMPRVAAAAAARAGVTPPARPVRPAGLTAREVEVLALVADGATNKQIAARLHLSVKTVERHLLNIYGKAGVRNRSEATAFAVRHGLA